MELGTKEFNDSAMEMFGGKPKQQTAVEWLAEQMMHPSNYNPYIERAKEMEKQQIIDAVDETNSKWKSQKAEIILTGEQYYNEKFKNKYYGTNSSRIFN